MSYTTFSLPRSAGFRTTEKIEERSVALALDPGLTLGWAAIHTETRRLVGAGFMGLGPERLYAHAASYIRVLLAEFSPRAVALEDYFIGPQANHPTYKASIEVRGAIKAAAEDEEVAWTHLNPATVRRNLGLKGKTTDAQVRDLVIDLFKVPAKYRPDESKKTERFFPSHAGRGSYDRAPVVAVRYRPGVPAGRDNRRSTDRKERTR